MLDQKLELINRKESESRAVQRGPRPSSKKSCASAATEVKQILADQLETPAANLSPALARRSPRAAPEAQSKTSWPDEVGSLVLKHQALRSRDLPAEEPRDLDDHDSALRRVAHRRDHRQHRRHPQRRHEGPDHRPRGPQHPRLREGDRAST